MNKTFELINILETEDEVVLYRSDIAYGDRISRYFTREGIGILTLRELSVNNLDSLSVCAKHFVIKNSEVYLYESELDKFILLQYGHEDILKVVQDNHQVNIEILNSYHGQVDMLEDCIYERDVPRHFMDTWFDLKQKLLKVERYFNRYVLVLKDYMKDQSSKGTIDIAEGDSLIEKASVSLGQSSGLVSRLDTMHNYYSSVKNDKLNKNIYFLTLISGIFLPLNLIVGFFGMNTENLFFKDQPQGTLFVVYILGTVIFTLTIGFRLTHFIDKSILRRSLGKYKLYQAVSKKVEKIEKVFKV